MKRFETINFEEAWMTPAKRENSVLQEPFLPSKRARNIFFFGIKRNF